MSESRRICEVVYCFELAGSEVLAADLIRHWHRSGIDVIAVATHQGHGPLSEQLADEGITCYALDLESASLLGKIAFHVRLWRIFRKHAIDVVHVHHMAFQRDIYRAARFAGVRRIVVTEHTNKEMLQWPEYFEVSSKMAWLADDISVIHPKLHDYFLEEFGVPEEKVHMIPNGVDTELYAPGTASKEVRDSLGLQGHEHVILWVGRFEDDKDPMNAIKAIEEVPENVRHDCAFVMAGTGALADECHDYVTAAGLSDCIRFTGRITNVAEVMKLADLFILSSQTEGFPLVLLEAMSTGIPCVSTDVGGITALVDDHVVAVPARDSRALADGIQQALESPALRKSMADRGRQLILEKFDAVKMRRDYTALVLG